MACVPGLHLWKTLKSDPQALAMAPAQVCRSWNLGRVGESFPWLLGTPPRQDSLPPSCKSPLAMQGTGEGKGRGGRGEEMFFFFNWKQ